MYSLLIAFIISFFLTNIIIKTQIFHGKFSLDEDLKGPQKFHKNIVPRIGGAGILLGLTGAFIFQYLYTAANSDGLVLLLCTTPVFFIGFSEDLTKKISVRKRLIITAIGALLASLFMGAKITRLDIPGIDLLFLYPLIAIIFTVFAISGLVNAYNIIDGFNGLSSMVGMITLLGLGYIGLKVNDPFIAHSSFVMIAAILGFFIWNYPRGLIFLGDCGAYLIGFWIATLSVLIVCRNDMISPWFPVLLNAYPIWETIFSMYRRKFHLNKSLGLPDGAHFHSLLFRRVLNKSRITNEKDWFSANSKTSPYLWIMCSSAIIPAILFWNSTILLIIFLVIYINIYSWIYKRLVRLKTPKFLVISLKIFTRQR
jgi:UDP-N-acetylmuramyl pentapeptide phosphotransferase/UDP-N-acetylglucosamine-1-phosphate transferase